MEVRKRRVAGQEAGDRTSLLQVERVFVADKR
jgi:hypothetical protein